MKMWRTKANSVHIGYFENELEAARAYDAAKLRCAFLFVLGQQQTNQRSSLHNFRTTPRLNFPESAVARAQPRGPAPSITNMFLARDSFNDAVLGPVKAANAAKFNANAAAAASDDGEPSAASASSPQQGSQANSTSKRITTAKYRGVMWDSTAGSWRAKLKFKGKTWYLGIYRDQLAAALAYDAACFYVYRNGRFLNFPENDYAEARLPQPPPPWLKPALTEAAGRTGQPLEMDAADDDGAVSDSAAATATGGSSRFAEGQPVADVIGVRLEGGKYVARIELLRSLVFVGAYASVDDARRAYDVAALRLTNGRLPINEQDADKVADLGRTALPPEVETLAKALSDALAEEYSPPSASSAAMAAERKGSKEKVAMLRAEFKRRKTVVQKSEMSAQNALAAMAAEFAPSGGGGGGGVLPNLAPHITMPSAAPLFWQPTAQDVASIVAAAHLRHNAPPALSQVSAQDGTQQEAKLASDVQPRPLSQQQQLPPPLSPPLPQ